LRSKLSKSEKRIVQFLLNDTHSFARLNVKEVAAAAEVSEPTVVRFCRRVGCKGFKDLKIQIIQDLAYRQATQEGEAGRAREFQDSHRPPSDERRDSRGPLAASNKENVSDKIHDAAVAALSRVHAALDWRSVDAAARAIAQARRVVIYGIGGSSAVMANETHNRLFRLNISSIPHTDSYMQRMSATTLSDKDVAIFISSTGRPRTLLDSLELARYYGAKCIGITPQDGPMGRDVDICIHLELTQGGVHRFHPNPMRYAQLYLIDCIAYAVALQLGEAAELSLKRMRASVASLHGIAPLQPIGD
jgi:RpiR family transcriptional regulator, carbohydrate utilization regulator